MKYLKALGLATIAVAALAVFLGAASAQATVLCATTSTPCNNRWGVKTEIDLSLAGGEFFKLKEAGGEVLDECGESTWKITTTTTGSETTTVVGSVATADVKWAGCTTPTNTTAGGEVEFHWISGTDNATPTGKGVKVTVGIFGVSCVYGFGTGTDIGTFTGGASPKVDLNAVVAKQEGGFVCPAAVTMAGVYESNPLNMYAEEK